MLQHIEIELKFYLGNVKIKTTIIGPKTNILSVTPLGYQLTTNFRQKHKHLTRRLEYQHFIFSLLWRFPLLLKLIGGLSISRCSKCYLASCNNFIWIRYLCSGLLQFCRFVSSGPKLHLHMYIHHTLDAFRLKYNMKYITALTAI